MRPAQCYMHTFSTHTVVVDNFKARLPGTLTFLTHFHSDHYEGITKGAEVYCSQMTADILHCKFKNTKTVVVSCPIDLGGLLVTPIPANHTPDSVMYLFEDLKTHTTVLFTGDFKYDIAQAACQGWIALRGAVSKLVLDTTYIDEPGCVPQSLAISKAVRYVQERFVKSRHKVLISSYTVGKERLICAFARALGIKFYPLTASRKDSLKAIYGEDYGMYFTDEDDDSGAIVTAQSQDELRKHASQYHSFDGVFVVEATGWVRTFSAYPDKLLKKIVHVQTPYSEHCSAQELRNFVAMLGKCDMGIFSILARDEKDNERIVAKLKSKSPATATLLPFVTTCEH